MVISMVISFMYNNMYFSTAHARARTHTHTHTWEGRGFGIALHGFSNIDNKLQHSGFCGVVTFPFPPICIIPALWYRQCSP